jgi:methionine sulfoxide reductase catalytic subunit
MNIGRPRKSWELTDSTVTPPEVWLKRRKLLVAMGIGLVSAGAVTWTVRERSQSAVVPKKLILPSAADAAYVPKANPAFRDAGRALTDESLVLSYNNFYEFSTNKEDVSELARGWRIDPYGLVIDGLVERPGTIGIEQVEALGLEERIYRFRCVEAWSMTVPWGGVPLAALLKHVGVKSSATHVAFSSVHDPARMPGQKNTYFTWPYYEGLTIAEAMNELSFVATGLYGKRLSPQNGAPLRVVLPWKYGFKGPKSVVRITLTDQQPNTFWNDIAADEYDFLGNVDPTVPHPRWTQASEKVLGSGDRIPTLPYNGYGAQVASLYQ